MLKRESVPFVCAVALLCIWVGTVSRTAAASDREAEKKALEQVEQTWLENENNPEALERILAEDFLHVLPTGMVTKAQQIAYLRRRKPMAKEGERHFEDLKIRIYGDTAIANGVVVQTGLKDEVEKRTAFTDVFVLRSGRWQAVNAQETPLTARAR